MRQEGNKTEQNDGRGDEKGLSDKQGEEGEMR